MNKPVIEHLRGETDPADYDFLKNDGSIGEGVDYIFPLFKQNDDGHTELVGTGFFINKYSVFCTAKHVVEDVFDEDMNQTHALFACCVDSKTKAYWQRSVETISMHEVADIAIGVLDPIINKEGIDKNKPVKKENIYENQHVILNAITPPVGSYVSTYAHPQSTAINSENGTEIFIAAKDFNGKVVEHHIPIRDKVMMPFRCFQTSINVYGGASGGPVFYEGSVVGVNTSSVEGAEDCSFITPIGYLFDLAVHDALIDGTKYECAIPVKELVKRRFIPFIPINMDPVDHIRERPSSKKSKTIEKARKDKKRERQRRKKGRNRKRK